MKRNILLPIVTILVFIFSANAGIVRQLDTFEPTHGPFIADGSVSGSFSVDYSDGNDTIGTQRDSIIVLGRNTKNLDASVSFTDSTLVLGFDQDSPGYFQLQLDGADSSPTVSVSPGLGNADLTDGNSAFAFLLDITCDHDALYSLRVYGSSLTVFATYNFTAAATFTPISYFIPYTLFSGSLSSFISVNAITLSVDVSVPNLDTTALDTSVYTFATFGYIVSGYAYKDCNRDGVQNPGEIGLEGANVTLRNTPSNTVFKTVLTDANGLFTFVGLGNFTYNVCVTMPGFTLTQPATGCRVAVLTNFKDVTDLAYGFTTTTSLTAPPPKTVEACGCTTPNCTGTATGASCGTGGILYNDSTTVTVCPQVITRTWYINGTTTTATQIITVPDTTKPTIVDQAANQNVSCSNQVPKLSDWVAAHGYANATDCNSIRWFNNWNGTTPGNGNCGFRQVTFFANDTCGNVNTTTATWTVYDGVAPVFTSFAANITTDCNTNGDDFNALNQWLRNHANANATDNCEKSITYTNNYNGTLTRGCNNFVTVTFTASDNCGSAASVDGTFTIKDDTPPFVSTPPKDSGAACKGDGSAVNAFNAWLSANGGGNASDACTAVVWKNNATELQLGCNQPNIVQFNVSDLCSHTLTFTANFLITDSTGPKLTTQPTNLRVNCSADVAGSFALWVANHAGAIAQDDCTGSTVSWSDNSNTIARPLPQCNAVTVTFTVRDACNTPQSTSFQSTFTTFDDTPPYFTADPQNKQVLCNSDINAQFNQWLTSNAGATANDTCNSNPVIRNDFPVNGTIPSKCKDSVSVLFTVSDGCNNIISKSAIFSVFDDSPPVISPQAKDQYQECNFTTNQVNYKAWLDSNGGANATDSCGGVSWTHNGTNTINNNVCSDIRPIAFTATDSCGLPSVTIATFNLTDTKDPILQSPAVDRPAQCDGTGNINDFANWITTHANASATDACTGVFWTTNSTVLNPFVNCNSITPILFTANDRCAHSVSTVATYSISDTQSPVITTQPTDASAECDGYGNGNDIQQWLNNHGGAVAFDICDLTNLTWTTSFNNTISTCRTVNVIFTVTDSCGRSASANANFTVIDSTKPVFNPPVANQTVQCDGLGNTADYQTWVKTMGGAKATDVCSISVTYNNTAPAVGPVGCGTVRAAFLATDQCGNTGVSIGTFTVIDSFPPTIDNEAQDQTVECDGSGNVVDLNNWLLVNGGATATDTCSTQLLVWSNDYRRVTAISNCTSLATVTFSVTDTCNNTARTTATFTIVDTTPPSVAPSASNLLLECDVAINPAQIQAYLANHGGAAAEDQCSATVRWSNNFVATADQCGNGVGVVFTVQDICGNAATTNASITVDDNVPPKFSSFPADKALDCSNCSTPACTGTPVVSDDCAAASSLSLTYTDFNHTQVTIGYCPGDEVITRVWKVTDPCGNVNIRNQTLIVQFADPTGPCVPTLCPPCDEDALTCCEANSAPQSCLPVSCKAVPCLQVPCTPVECIPQVCGSFPPSPTPTPAVVPGAVHDYYVACEPVYVYVYNDDGINDEEDNQPVIKYIYEYIYGVESVENSASSYSLLMSFFLLCISLFF